ncbi:hypothetical protein BGX38DRAFT_1083830, partial [Terfezia claveryi]
TGSWWWDQQKQVPIGCMVVPVLLASDQTHLTNFSGDKKLWPLYMSIGNIKSTIRNKPTMNAILGHPVEAQELDTLQVTHGILSSILSPLADAKIQQGTEMVCCDEKVRNCVPRLSAWLADHMENVMIHGILSNRCPVCIAPPNKFG